MSITQELGRQMAIRAALVSTINTTGWPLVKELAEKVVKQAVQDALAAEDGTGEQKRLKASALQKGFAQLFDQIDSIKNYDPTVVSDGGFGVLESSASEYEAIRR